MIADRRSYPHAVHTEFKHIVILECFGHTISYSFNLVVVSLQPFSAYLIKFLQLWVQANKPLEDTLIYSFQAVDESHHHEIGVRR
jgi:hypothetical protein